MVVRGEFVWFVPIVRVAPEVDGDCTRRKDFRRTIRSPFDAEVLDAGIDEQFALPVDILLLQVNVAGVAREQFPNLEFLLKYPS